MAITHTFVSPVTEGTGSGSTFIGPTEWNNSHTIAAGTVTRAMAATDLVGWQFLGSATSAGGNAIVGPVTLSASKDHLFIQLIVAGYGSAGIARLQLGNTTTIDTTASYAFQGITIASQSASSTPAVTGISSAATGITGIPVSGETTVNGRIVNIHLSNPGAHSKYVTIQQAGVSTSASLGPNVAFIGGLWGNSTNGIGIVQFQAFNALTGTTTVTFNSGTEFSVWGRNNGE